MYKCKFDMRCRSKPKGCIGAAMLCRHPHPPAKWPRPHLSAVGFAMVADFATAPIS